VVVQAGSTPLFCFPIERGYKEDKEGQSKTKMDADRGKDDSSKGILLTPYPSYAQTHLAVDTIFKIGERPYPKFENRIEIEIGGTFLLLPGNWL
jgi:hypothetical protein